MGEFDLWLGKLFLNLDEGNLREALYCSDMALYTAEKIEDEPTPLELSKVYLCRARILDLMGRPEEARSCYKIVVDLES